MDRTAEHDGESPEDIPVESCAAVDSSYEVAVLSLILGLSKATPEITRRLGDGTCFYDDRHRLIYETALALLRKGRRPDLITVVETMRERRQLEQAGSADYLSGLPNKGVDCCAEQYCAGVLRSYADRAFDQALGMAFQARQRGESVEAVLQALVPSVEMVSKASERPAVQRVETADQVLVTAEEITWCVEGLLPSDGLGILCGDSGIGKSWMSLALGRAVATESKWLGRFRTTQGSVVYVDEENGRNCLADRLRKLGVRPDTGWPLYFLAMPGMRLDTEEGLEDLRRIIQQYRATLAVIDPLSRVHELDENKASDMKRLMAPLAGIARAEKCALLLNHHSRKKSDRSNEASEMMRGSSAIRGAADLVLYVTKRGEGQLRVQHTKARFGRPVPPFLVAMLESDGVLSVVAAEGGQTMAVSKTAKATRIIERMLAEARGFVFRKNLEAACIEQGIRGKTFAKALVLFKGRLRETWLPAPGVDAGGQRLKAFALREKAVSGEEAGPQDADFERGAAATPAPKASGLL